MIKHLVEPVRAEESFPSRKNGTRTRCLRAGWHRLEWNRDRHHRWSGESGRVSRTHVPSTDEYRDGVLVHSRSGLHSVPDQLNQLTELLPCLKSAHPVSYSSSLSLSLMYTNYVLAMHSLLASEREQFNISRSVVVTDFRIAYHTTVCVASPDRKSAH